MNTNTSCKAVCSLITLRTTVRQPSRRKLQLRQCLRALSSTTVGQEPRASFRSTQQPVSRSFSVSTCMKKKQKADKASSPAGDDAGKDSDPRDFTALDSEISTAHDRLREALGKLRSGGRFNPEVLEKLRVQPDKSEKTRVPLSDLAHVILKGRTVHVIVGEKEHLKPVSSAITTSDLSLTPHPDPTGTNPLLLEIKIPPPTAESRQNAASEAAKLGEKASVSIRDARAKQHKKHRAMQSMKGVSPDNLRKAAAEMEKVVEKAQAEVKRTVDGAKKMLEAV